MSKEKFIVMLEWCNSFDNLSNEEMGILFKNFISYHRNEKIDTSDRIVNSIWSLLQPNIERINKDYQSRSKNGSNGGAPKGNSNASKQPKNNQETTEKQPKNNQETTEKQPKNNQETTEKQPNDNRKTNYKEKEKAKAKEIDILKNDINRTSSENLDDEKFYNKYLIDIHHIMDTFKVDKKEAIELQREVMKEDMNFNKEISNIFN
jgi:hypothetical protein